MFHLSHFHRLVRFCWFGLVVGGVCLCVFAFLLSTDQPVRSSYQPMTIIAYLHDCHCRYDERSNVQKKTPLAWCRLSSSAIIARCYYVPPTILVPPMLVDAVDHLVHYCLLALSLLLQVGFSPSQARYSSLWCLFVVSSLPLHRRGGLCGTSLWHIVRPVLQCSSPPLRYPAWVLSSPHYDPFMTAFPLFL